MAYIPILWYQLRTEMKVADGGTIEKNFFCVIDHVVRAREFPPNKFLQYPYFYSLPLFFF